MNAIQKPLSSLKLILKSLTNHLKGFSIGFTEVHAELYAETLLDFVIHHRQNETRSLKRTPLKTMRVHSIMSLGGLMQ
jgi:hypothetical protein